MQTRPDRTAHSAIAAILLRLDRLDPGAAMAIACLLWGLVFACDWFASPRLPFGPYYLLPICLAAWCLPGRFTVFLVITASIGRTFVLSRMFAANPTLYYAVEVLSTLCVYALMAWLLVRLKDAYRLLADKAAALETRAERAERRTWLDTSIRRAVLDDVDRIVDLVALGGADGGLSRDVTTMVRQAALRGIYADSIRKGIAMRPTWTGQEVHVPIEFWVSQINNQIAGFFMVMGMDDKEGPERELHAIVTATDYRGVGVGAAMVDFFCSHYYGRKLYAAVMPDSKMHRMLKRRGFLFFANAREDYVFVERVEWPKEKGLWKPDDAGQPQPAFTPQ